MINIVFFIYKRWSLFSSNDRNAKKRPESLAAQGIFVAATSEAASATKLTFCLVGLLLMT